MTMPILILDSVNYKFRRELALSKRSLGWAGSRNSVADRRGYLLDMSNHQQIRY